MDLHSDHNAAEAAFFMDLIRGRLKALSSAVNFGFYIFHIEAELCFCCF